MFLLKVDAFFMIFIHNVLYYRLFLILYMHIHCCFNFNSFILSKVPNRSIIGISGIVGARQVKWLTTIILSEEESGSHWQRSDYKYF